MSGTGQKRFLTTAGRTYWIDLFDRENGDAREIFPRWVELTNEAFPGAVVVLATEDYADSEPPSQWVKFRTNESVPWTSNVPTMGFPTPIPGDGSSVQSRSDTSTAADAMAAVDEETNDNKKLALALMVGGAIVVGVVAVALIVAEASAVTKVVAK